MEIAKKYSHLNGEEYLLVHHGSLYEEIKETIASIDASTYKTKISNEKSKKGQRLYNPISLNRAFKNLFRQKGWEEKRYRYVITTNFQLLQEIIPLPYSEQQQIIEQKSSDEPIKSYKQTDFFKEGIAIEVQFGKYAFVAYDLFVKHLLFYSGSQINVGIEILPTKKMQSEMSTGIAFYEGEVYNVLRHGRSSPPVPLLILGIEP